MLARKPPTTPEAGVRWSLSEDDFMRWWSSAITIEDANEFIQIYDGHKLAARLVCALDYLSLQDDGAGGDQIFRAYLVAAEIPVSDQAVPVHRQNAEIIYRQEATAWLLDRVRYRASREVHERIRKRTARRLEKLYDQSEEGELLTDAALQRTVLDGANKFLAMGAREQAARDATRQKAALQAALERASESGAPRELPTKEDVRHFLQMIRDEFGGDVLAELVAEVAPRKLT